MEHLDFERKLKNTIESKMSEVFTLDEIYLKAEERQNELFKIVFQECFYYAIFNYISSISLENIKEKILQLQTIKVIKDRSNIDQFAFIVLDQSISLKEKIEFFKKENFIIDYEYFKNKNSAEKFLIDNYEFFKIKVLDGNVKRRERVVEKAQDRYGGDFKQVNDINRLTIVANSTDIIDLIIKNLKYSYEENFLNREEWEMKPFGMITRGSYLFINNFPCEIHFNEPLQMKTSKDITHRIYELYRMNLETDEQKFKFKQDFKSFINDSLETNKYIEYDSDIKKFFQYYIDDSNKLAQIPNEKLVIIKKDLLELHIDIHQKAIYKAENDWQTTYLASIYQYNHKNPFKKIVPISSFSEEIKKKASLKFSQSTQECKL